MPATQPTPPEQLAAIKRQQLINDVAALLTKHAMVWRGPTQRQIALKGRQTRMANNIRDLMNQRALQPFMDFLFTQSFDACEHIGRPDMAGVPNLCWLHKDTNPTLLCEACLVEHDMSDHSTRKLANMKCESCRQPLPRKDKLDSSPHHATTRRSVPVEVYDSHRINVTRMEPGNEWEPPGITTLKYKGKTMVTCAHMLCFDCRAKYVAILLGHASPPPRQP